MTESRVASLLCEDGPLEARSQALESIEAEMVVAGAIEAFKEEAVVGTAFGAGGLCVLHMAQQADPEAIAFYIDTSFVFDETREVMRRWEEERKLRLQRVLPILTPEAQAAEHGEALWARDPDKCCNLRKVEPNDRYLSSKKLWIAALRRDESASRASIPMLSEVTLGNGHKILKLCPIVSWSKKDVWRYIFAHELPYNVLHDRGYPSIGCTHCTHAVGADAPERAGRWSGQAKLECGLHTARKDD